MAFTYDKAGNLREQKLTASTALRFTHDAWNRLVKVQHVTNPGGSEIIRPRGEYEYNGLFQRVIKRSDKDITDGSNSLDEQRLLYYSGGWQVVEERIDDHWSSGHSTDRIVQHVWGLRYIDDLVLNRQDSNADGDYIDSTDFTHYALTDHQFSVVALIDSAGNLIERVSYTPYGEARHHWRQDVDGDGDIDATDQSLVHAALTKRIYESGYNVDADFDRDGIIDSNDSRQIGSGAFRAALPAGWISSLTTGNTIGFSGYVFNREIDAGGLYTVRFRHYDPVWGRWISRDPAGYVDSNSLYGYGWGSPLDGSDPFGESWNPFTREYWYYFKEGWLEVRDYWYGKGPLGRAYFWGTHIVVGGFVIYAIGSAGGITIGWVQILRITHPAVKAGQQIAYTLRIISIRGVFAVEMHRLRYWWWRWLMYPHWHLRIGALSKWHFPTVIFEYYVYRLIKEIVDGITPSGSSPSSSPPSPGHFGQPLNCPSNTEWPGGPRMSMETPNG